MKGGCTFQQSCNSEAINSLLKINHMEGVQQKQGLAIPVDVLVEALYCLHHRTSGYLPALRTPKEYTSIGQLCDINNSM